jgi:hypothetical protein
MAPDCGVVSLLGPRGRRNTRQAAASRFEAEHLPAEGWIVEIGRQTRLEAVEAQFVADRLCFREIHAERILCQDQFDERAAVFVHDNALTARRGGFGEVRFGLASGRGSRGSADGSPPRRIPRLGLRHRPVPAPHCGQPRAFRR